MRHDEFFETVAKTENQLPWKVVAGFTDFKNTPPPKKQTLRQMLSKSIFSKIPTIPPPPIANDDFDFQFESPSLSTEINSVPPATDGGTQENETTQEMSFNSPPPVTRTSKRIEKPTQAFLESVEQQDLEFHDFHRDEYIP